MKKTHLGIILAIIAVLAGVFCFFFFQKRSETMAYSDFLNHVQEKDIEELIYEQSADKFQVTLANSSIVYEVTNPKSDGFLEFLLTNDVHVTTGSNTNVFALVRFVILLGAGAGLFFYIRQKDSSKLKIEQYSQDHNPEHLITMEQIAGNMEAKAMVRDVIQFIQTPEKYTATGAKMPRGLLLYGPPGTGKTLMAKGIAGSARVPFFAMSGSDFIQMYVGVGASRIRSLFKKAKERKKAVIFIDEIDAIGKKRGRGGSSSSDEYDQTLNALLTEMSGFEEHSGIVVIAATNRVDTLDPALLRPGRFDRQIEIGLPDIIARKKILSLYLMEKPVSDDVNIDLLAKNTVYFSGAMLENFINEAAIQAANEGDSYITSAHLDKAYYTIIAGAQKQDYSYISETDRQVTACHEAGHALAAALLMPEHEIAKVTIIPSVKGAGGFNVQIPKDSFYLTKTDLQRHIMMLLAGRAAEELFFGKENVTTGAVNDIEKASSQILDYVNKFGMDEEYGLFNSKVLETGTADGDIPVKCREHMNRLYKDIFALLKENQAMLENITWELLEKESIDGDDIKRLCA